MKIPYFCVNTFCKASFSGNPAGVCLLEEWLSTDELQKIASQLNQPETTFVIPLANGKWSIRWFSPLVEIDLCGHGTMGAAHVLYQEGLVKKGSTLFFASSVGELVVNTGQNKLIDLDMPTISSRKSSITPLLVEGLGAYPDEVYLGKDCMCVFSEEETVEELKPDFRLLSGIQNCRGLIVTALTSRPEFHFVSRFFAPAIGIEEDQVTGSTHCMMAPYWAKKIGKTRLNGWQASARGGEVKCRLKGDRVELSGICETFLKGKISI